MTAGDAIIVAIADRKRSGLMRRAGKEREVRPGGVKGVKRESKRGGESEEGDETEEQEEGGTRVAMEGSLQGPKMRHLSCVSVSVSRLLPNPYQLGANLGPVFEQNCARH